MLGDDMSINLLSKMMEMSTSRQKIIAHNLANANTPGYTRRELDFEGELKKILQNNDFDKLQKLEGKVVLDESGTARNDGNNVDVSLEMNEMAQNGVLFSLMQKSLQSRLNLVKSAIR